MSEGENTELLELVWKHSILYSCTDQGYTRNDKLDLVRANIAKGLHELLISVYLYFI